MVGAVLHGRMPVAPAWPLRAGEPGDIDPARTISARYGTPHILLGDLDPARLTASGLSPSYLDDINTVADTSGQTLHLLFERSGGAAVGANLLSGAWTLNTPGGTASASEDPTGTLNLTGDGTNSAQADKSFTTEAGATYAVDADIATNSAIVRVGTSQGGTQLMTTREMLVGTGTSGVQRRAFFRATGTTSWVRYNRQNAGLAVVSNIRIRKIAGNHLYQATSADEPTLVQESGIWRLRGDGASKNLLTPLVPAASMTMIVACEFNAVSDCVIGANDAANANRMHLFTDTAGLLAGGVGTQSITTIKGGSDIRDIPGVAVIRVDGTTVSLGWKALSGLFSWVYQAAQAGVPTTTTPLRVGAYNNNGTGSNYFDGDVFRVLAQQSAYTDAEISAIASQWSRELGGTG